jgi:hypothetical protein
VVAPAEAGLTGSVVGPSEVRAHRVVIDEPEDVARALIEWFDRNELLAVLRQQPGRVTFEPIGGMQAALRRGGAAFGSGVPKFMLARATLVSATFTRLESGYCHVSLSADLAKTRSGYVGGSVALGSVGVVGAGVLAAMSPFLLLAAVPLLVGGAMSWYTLKLFQPVADRTALGLERALDYLERGGVKPGHQIPPKSGGLLDAVASEIRRAIAASTERSRQK